MSDYWNTQGTTTSSQRWMCALVVDLWSEAPGSRALALDLDRLPTRGRCQIFRKVPWKLFTLVPRRERKEIERSGEERAREWQ